MITELRRGMNVKRFHAEERIREESVGHHSANVCCIILRLCPDASRALLITALLHDVAEGHTGDIPYPTKQASLNIREGLKIMEYEWLIANKIPNPGLTEDEAQLLKLADMMDLVLSSLEEMGRGNRFAKRCVEAGQKYIQGMDIPVELEVKCEEMVREVKAQWQLTIDR